MVQKTTLEEQYFIDSEPKGEVISSKIEQLAAIYTSKFKRVCVVGSMIEPHWANNMVIFVFSSLLQSSF